MLKKKGAERDEMEAITPALSRFTEFAYKLLQAAGVSVMNN